MLFMCITVLATSENDHRPYDPFGDDDDTAVTSSVPVVPVTKTLATAAATPSTVSTAFPYINRVKYTYIFVLFNALWAH